MSNTKNERYQQGLQVRTEVMGEAFVAKAMQGPAFTEPLQDFLNEHAWGSTWTQDDLPRSTRSLLTIAMLTALKCPNELKGHVRGALRNGCTVAEIQAVLLHAAVYCGAPAARDAFITAQAVVEEWEQSQQ